MKPMDVMLCPECRTRVRYVPGGFCPSCAVSLDESIQHAESLQDPATEKNFVPNAGIENPGTEAPSDSPIWISDDSNSPDGFGTSFGSAPSNGPVSSRAQDPETFQITLFWIWFSLRGRIPRLTFWVAQLLTCGLLFLANTALESTRPSYSRNSLRPPESRRLYRDDLGRGYGVEYEDSLPDIYRPGTQLPIGSQIAELLISVLAIWAFVAISVKRLHDLDLSGWYIFMCLIPILGPFLYLIICGFVPGQRAMNRFGSQPA